MGGEILILIIGLWLMWRMSRWERRNRRRKF